MKVEVAVLGSPSRTICTASVDGKQHLKKKTPPVRAQEMYKRRGGRPGPPVPNTSAYGLCGRKVTLNAHCFDSVVLLNVLGCRLTC